MRIALVDDIEDVRSRMAELIEEFAGQHHLHYQLDSYASGEEFLEHFEAHSYDIIFLDIYMDGISGTEAAEKIRETDNYVLLIFLTSSTWAMHSPAMLLIIWKSRQMKKKLPAVFRMR